MVGWVQLSGPVGFLQLFGSCVLLAREETLLVESSSLVSCHSHSCIGRLFFVSPLPASLVDRQTWLRMDSRDLAYHGSQDLKTKEAEATKMRTWGERKKGISFNEKYREGSSLHSLFDRYRNIPPKFTLWTTQKSKEVRENFFKKQSTVSKRWLRKFDPNKYDIKYQKTQNNIRRTRVHCLEVFRYFHLLHPIYSAHCLVSGHPDPSFKDVH